MGEFEDSPAHREYKEFVCDDGGILTKVPTNSIRLLSATKTKDRIATMQTTKHGKHQYDSYVELIENGAYAFGIPIVYRTAKGSLFASYKRDSDIIIYLEQTVKLHSSAAQFRNDVHPLLTVKIIDVENISDIPAKTDEYVEKQATIFATANILADSGPNDNDVAIAKRLLVEWNVDPADKGPMANVLRNVAAGRGAPADYLKIIRDMGRDQ